MKLPSKAHTNLLSSTLEISLTLILIISIAFFDKISFILQNHRELVIYHLYVKN